MKPALMVAALVSLGIGNDPYIRSRVDTGVADDKNAHCLWWGTGDLTFYQNQDGNPDTTGTTEFDAFTRSMAAWQDVSDQCGHLILRDGGRVPDRDIGWTEGSSSNRNLLVYRMRFCADVVPAGDSCWGELTCQNKHDCFDQAKGTIAITTTTYDRNTGEIYDADIEGNGAWFLFTTVDGPPCPQRGPFTQACVATDVQNTMTHEMGHALGLDHTLFTGSTMTPSAPAGEISKRILDSGSKSYVCENYPKGAPAQDCVITSAQRELGPSANGCSATGGTPLVGLLGLAFASRAWRRRRWVP